METFPLDKDRTSGHPERDFLASRKPHILMITNHGIHEWQVVPGLQDTGGQNVFVNQFSRALARFGFRVTTVNRGGYHHPLSGAWQKGVSFRGKYERIVYLEDGREEFVRKEDMHEQIHALTSALERRLSREEIHVDLLVTHYWDAAVMGVRLQEMLKNPVKHIWVPHSLGILKKRNLKEEQYAQLRIDERIEAERAFVPRLTGVASTSSLIREVLIENYGYRGPDLFLPPCVDTERYHPREVEADDPLWAYLAERTALTTGEVRRRTLVTEISRTDVTKGKDVLIKAFAAVRPKFPDTLLVLSIDEARPELAAELKKLIRTRGLEAHTAVVGSIWELLPSLYAATAVYCTPAIQEGFGMSAQEAAATAVPVIASDRVPFAVEYLLGSEARQIRFGSKSGQVLELGQGAVQVPANQEKGFARALELLLGDRALRRSMGDKAYTLTIPYFTWDNMVERFLEALDVIPPAGYRR